MCYKCLINEEELIFTGQFMNAQCLDCGEEFDSFSDAVKADDFRGDLVCIKNKNMELID